MLQQCAKYHRHRYLAEFDFRYGFRAANGFNNSEALKGIIGHRLTYRSANERGATASGGQKRTAAGGAPSPPEERFTAIRGSCRLR